MHHYPRNVGDYAKDTRHLSLAQHGAYSLLLDWYYASEQPLPGDVDMLCRICGAVKAEERKAVETVLGLFFTRTEAGLWFHKRVEKEIATYKARAGGGKKGMAERWKDKLGDNSTDNSQHKSSDNNQEPITKNQDNPLTPKGLSPSAQGELLEVPVNLPELKAVPETAKKEKGGRVRNELMDALVLAAGQTDLAHVTVPIWKEAAKALKTIREVEPEVTSGMIRSAAAAYRETWPTASLSASALAKHWGKFRPADYRKKEGGGVPVHESAVIVIDDGPDGWQDAWLLLYPFAHPQHWQDVPAANKDELIQWMRRNAA